MIRILLVDDQKSIREHLKSLLETEADFDIVGMVDNGYDAIEQVKLLLPDVVLMDVEMPDIDGVLATKIIAHSSLKTKVLVVTSYDSHDYVAKSIQAGAKGYILKGAPAGLFEQFVPTTTNNGNGDGGVLEVKMRDTATLSTADRHDFDDKLLSTYLGTIQETRFKPTLAVPDFEQPSELVLDITTSRPPRKSIGWYQAVALVIAGLGMTFSLYLLRQGLSKPATVPNEQERLSRLHDLPFTGKVEPVRVTKIDAISPGLVDTVTVKVGQSVKAGDRLLTIRNADAERSNQTKTLQYNEAVAAQKQAVLQQANQIQQQNLQQQQTTIGERQTATDRVNTIKLSIANYQRNLAPLRQQVAAANVEISASTSTEQPLEQKREAITRAQAIYERTLTTYQRLAKYQKEGALSQERVEQAEKEMTVAKSDLSIAQSDYDSAIAAARSATAKQIAQTKATKLQQELSLKEQAGQLQQLQAQLKAAESDERQLAARLKQLQEQQPTPINLANIPKPILEPLTIAITAPVAGTVLELLPAPGDRVFAGSKLVGMADVTKLKIGVELDPQQAALLKSGRRAVVKVGTQMETQEAIGLVTTISPPTDRSTQRIEVEFTNLKPTLLVGQMGTVYFPK
jgi:DNA-binding NarL/FixJ family response regulator/multidrug resistance efflux pump